MPCCCVSVRCGPAGVFVKRNGELMTVGELFGPGGVIEVDNGQGLTNITSDQVDAYVGKG